MTEQITPEVFNHLVGLAALELTAEEGEYLRRQLNNQLKAIHELEAIPLDADVPASLHGVPFPAGISQALRPDVWQPFSRPDEILSQAPSVDERYIIVPEIPHTDLE